MRLKIQNKEFLHSFSYLSIRTSYFWIQLAKCIFWKQFLFKLSGRPFEALPRIRSGPCWSLWRAAPVLLILVSEIWILRSVFIMPGGIRTGCQQPLHAWIFLNYQISRLDWILHRVYVYQAYRRFASLVLVIILPINNWWKSINYQVFYPPWTNSIDKNVD